MWVFEFFFQMEEQNPVFRPRIWIGLQFLSAALESFLAFMFTMLIFKPYGSLKIYTCQKHFLFEWYPMFYNPVVNFTRTLKCSSELVYPM